MSNFQTTRTLDSEDDVRSRTDWEFFCEKVKREVNGQAFISGISLCLQELEFLKKFVTFFQFHYFNWIEIESKILEL